MPTKPLIAIVDDDEAVRLAVRSLMRSVGLAAQVFSSAADFLGSADMARVACVILDITMPGMGGLALHRQLITSGYANPTIFITARPDDGTRAEALRQGALCYLRKPFAEDDLLGWVNVALGRPGAAGAKSP